MRMPKIHVTVWLLALLSGTISPSFASSGLEVDPAMQERIERTVAAIVTEDPAVQERFDELKALSGADRRTLLLQLALYLERSDSTEGSMGGAILLDRLEFTPEEKLDSVLPHVEEADSGTRRVLTEILGTIDRPDGGEPDFSFYESHLESDRPPPTRALILYMYEVSPIAALESMNKVYGGRAGGPGRLPDRIRDLEAILDRSEGSLSWPEADRTRALEILDALSRDPAWWIRLCAAEILGRASAFGAEEIARRLENDPDPLVRTAGGR